MIFVQQKLKWVLTAAALALSGCVQVSVETTNLDPYSDTSATEAAKTFIKTGDTAPAWRGVDLFDGSPVIFPDGAQGAPSVLVFWASWCPYSKAYLPYLEGLQWDYEDTDIKIISLNAKQREYGDPATFVQSLGFPLKVIRDADTIAADYGVEFVPGIFVVDGEGTVIYRRASTDQPAGPVIASQWDREVREALERALGRGP